MTRFAGLMAAAAVVSALTACGSTHTTVPSRVRDAIVKDYSAMAFVPGRLPGGYHYANWTNSKNNSGYTLSFLRGSGKNQDYVYLDVYGQSCPAPPKYPVKDTHTLHINGHTLKWLQSSVGPYVWRCMTNQGRSFVISGVSGSRQQLADLVGYAVPAH